MAARVRLNRIAGGEPMTGQAASHETVIVGIVAQHAEELASLWITRRVLVSAGATTLAALADHDERIGAHLDGCVVGGAAALEILQKQFDDPEPSAAFALAVVALERQDLAILERVIRAAEEVPQYLPGLEGAVQWISGTRLVGVVQRFLESDAEIRRRLGLVACRTHAADPRAALAALLADSRTPVATEALRVAAALGRLDTASLVQKLEDEPDEALSAAAAAASVLLGNRGRSLDLLHALVSGGAGTRELLELALRAASVSASHALLRQISAAPSAPRSLIIGAGVAGDTRYVPWLIEQMRDAKLSRVAGEAFSMMTGVDVTAARLDRPQPDGFESGPTEDASDASVDIDEDEGLPWPDPEKVAQWWTGNGGPFQDGVRSFMGRPLSREHCIAVLKAGCQRQRIAAAQYLCLLSPGTPLFNTSAPAWRQQKLLAQM